MSIRAPLSRLSESASPSDGRKQKLTEMMHSWLMLKDRIIFESGYSFNTAGPHMRGRAKAPICVFAPLARFSRPALCLSSSQRPN